MWKEFRPAVVSFLVLSVITGLLYPWVVTGLAQALFPGQANGSLIFRNGQPVGSEWIGQSFADPGYFWADPRPPVPCPIMGWPPAVPIWGRPTRL